MKKVSLLISSLILSSLAVSTSAQVTISGTPYTRLTTAFAAINAGAHTGAVVVEISGNISEGVAIASLNASGVGLANYTSVTIYPTVDNVISDGGEQAIIQLKGADNVIIDGDNPNTPGINRNLTFTNTSLGGDNTAIWISSNGITNGASNNIIRNCIIEGVDKIETTYGIISSGNSILGISADAAANNNQIVNNLIRRSTNGIALVGGNTLDNNWQIRDNVIGDLNTVDAIGTAGISVVNSLDLRIQNNVIAGVSSDVAQAVKGINLGQQVSDAIISGNSIHGIMNTATTPGYGAAGIYFNAISGSTNNVMHNNEIWEIGAEGDVTAWNIDNNLYGIMIAQGDGFDIFYNTINMTLDPEGGDGHVAALYVGAGVAPSAINMQNNILYNGSTVGTNYCIYNASSPSIFADIDYNLYRNGQPDLSYMGSAVPDLASWKALTQNDTGSVTGDITFIIAGDDLSVDNSLSSSWLVNGRGIAMPAYASDINGIARATIVGFPTDIGSREFSTLTVPDDAIPDAPPANGTTTTYTSGGRKIASIAWGAAGTVPTDLSVKYYPAGNAPLWVGPGSKINSYWHLNETTGVGYDFQLRLYFTEAENNALSDGQLTILRDSTGLGDYRNSGGFATQPYDADGRVVEWSNNLTTMRNYTLGNVPLGLELIAFTAKNNNNVNDLAWTTGSERNMDNFEVMHSTDGTNFSVIGKVQCKNEFMNNEYNFRDVAPVAGYNYYKLKMNETTGYSNYSNIVAVKNGAAQGVDITSIYPNPATAQVTVSLFSATDDALTLQVSDLAGRTVLTQEQAISAGNNNAVVNIADLAPGIYSVKAVMHSGATSISKLVKQ